MNDKEEIKTISITKEAFLFIINNFKTYFLLSLFPMFIYIMEQHLSAYLTYNYSDIYALTIGFVLIYIVTTYISFRYAINIHKFVIKNIKPEGYFSNIWNKTILWFGIYTILVMLAGGICGLFWGVFSGMSLIPIVGKIIAFFIIFGSALWFILARFSLIFPSVAVGDNVSLIAFGKTTKGARLTILIQFILIFIFGVLFFLIFQVFYELVFPNYYFRLLYMSIIAYLMLAWMITSLSFTYKRWKKL